MFYFLSFLLALILGFLFSLAIIRLAKYYKIVDEPDGSNGRKIHRLATPLLGGIGIFLAYFFVLFIFSEKFLSGALEFHHLLGFFLGALVITIGGFLDDKFNLSPAKQIIFPLLAVVMVILGGIEIARLSFPFGGIVNLGSYISVALLSFWLLGMMYTTKLLDGVDGLVSGIGVIASFIIFLFTLSTNYYQPDIAFAAIVFSGAVLGFLILNWHPAKIFLGEGGSLLIGYVLAVLSIISGSKIAMALLIMGIPILDVFWTILRRLLTGKNPFRFSDKKHLHHRLLDLGLNQKQTVIVFYLLSLTFGLLGLFLQSKGKFLALIFLVILMFLIVVFFWRLDRKKRTEKNIISVGDGAKKEKLLFHVCCAPCASYVSLEILSKKYELSWYFYNSNLESLEEHERRLKEVKMVATKFSIPLIVEPYNKEKWLEKVKGYEGEKEGSSRCFICYLDRLEKTASLAKKNGFDLFGTSLLVSLYKNEEVIKKYASSLAGKYSIKFLTDSIRSQEIYQKSQALAKDLGIYRQKFCGCEFSEGTRFVKE